MNTKTFTALLIFSAFGFGAIGMKARVSADDGERANVQQAALQALQQRQATIIEMLPRLEKATVCLQAGGGSGSGVIVNKDGLILTAAHVVDKNKQMKVRFSDGRTLTGKVLGAYNPADAAMVQIVEEGPYPFVEIAAADNLAVGQNVIALGHPSGFDEQRGMPLRVGHVCSRNGDFFAADCALIGGDSGGPSFNLKGQLIGIHSNITGDLSVNNDIAMQPFYQYWDQMLQGKRMGRPFEPGSADEPEDDEPADGEGADSGEDEDSDADGADAGAGEENQQSLHQQFFLNEQAVCQETQVVPLANDGANGRMNQTMCVSTGGFHIDAAQVTATPHQQEGDDQPQTDLQKLLKQSRDSQGRLKVSRERLRGFRDQLNQRVEALSPVGGRKRDDWGMQYQNAFAAQVDRYCQSMFSVFVSGRKVATATVVDPAGYLVTKASEIDGRTASLEIQDGSYAPVNVVAVSSELDLALLKVTDTTRRFIAVDLASEVATSDPYAAKGVLCCAVGTSAEFAAGFGVVSVAARPLNGNTSAYLGVTPSTVKDGARLDQLVANGPAARAGLKQGDIVEAVDDEQCPNAEALVKLIESRLPNETVTLSIRRADTWLTLPTMLGDKSKVAAMPGAREQGTDGMSTKMSRRRWNFTEGIQHDCAIQPKDCGGALVDLNGRLLGVNIARAGRIKSYAIPTDLVAEFVNQNLNGSGKAIE